MNVHFWPHTTSSDVASFRLRCRAVIRGLRLAGIEASIYKDGDEPKKLVLSKRYDSQSIQKALELRVKFGTQLYLDICDNHFYYDHADEYAVSRANQLRQAIHAVDVVITSSSYLAEVVRDQVTNCERVAVIGDLVELPEIASFYQRLRHPFSYFHYARLRISLGKLARKKSLALVWFGNHGSPYARGGMEDLSSIRNYLERMHTKNPISLTVVSNSYSQFRVVTAGWNIPVFYVPWSKCFFSQILFLHKFSVIPIRANPFTLAKSDNRVLTSLVHGLKVLVDSIPSYEKFKAPVFFNPWGDERDISLNELMADDGGYDLEFFIRNNADVLKCWEAEISTRPVTLEW